MKRLTTPTIKGYMPRETQYEIRDSLGPGLRLVVYPTPKADANDDDSGEADGKKKQRSHGVSRSWIMRTRLLGGKLVKMTLGTVDVSVKETADDPVIGGPLTVGQARQLANELDRKRLRGINIAEFVAQEKAKLKPDPEKVDEDTFEAFARLYIRRHAKMHQRRWRDTAFILGFDPDDEKLPVIKGSLTDRWRGRAAAAITRADVVKEVDRATDIAETRGNKLLAAVRQVFGWHVERGALDMVPTTRIKMPKPLKKLRRSRRLSDNEIRWLWRGLDECVAADEVPEAYAGLLRFVMFTAVRRDEARKMDEKEVTGRVWEVPGARMKNGLDHLVTLPKQAKAILDNLPRFEGSGLVFTLSGKTPIGNLNRYKTALHARMEASAGEPIAQWHMHDFRRNVRSYLSQVASVDVAERVLAHAIGGVREHYDLHEYQAEKARALESWAGEVERIVSGKSAKVVALKRRTRA